MKLSAFRSIQLFVIGFVMGVSDLIPGVSGGTIAFISGIYEELLYSIKQISGPGVRALIHGNIRLALRYVPFRFLLPLGFGILGAIFSLAHLLTWLLLYYPSYLRGFFFGLVLASTLIVLRRIKKWRGIHISSFVVAVVIAYMLVGLVPIETPNSLLAIFGSGVIAICAMILPGISGSFILVLLGKYSQILTAVTDRDIGTLAIFGMGCALGISVFAHFLTWLLAHYHDISVAILGGVMFGSIRKIWPWQEILTNGLEKNVLPGTFNMSFWIIIGLMGIAMALLYALDRRTFLKEQKDI